MSLGKSNIFSRVWELTQGHFMVLFDTENLICFMFQIYDGFWIHRFPKCLYFACTEDSARNNACCLNSLQISRKYTWHQCSAIHQTDADMCIISFLWTGCFNDIVKAAWGQPKLEEGKILIWSLLSYINRRKAEDFKSRLFIVAMLLNFCGERNLFQGVLMGPGCV